MDFNDVGPQKNFDVIPDGTIATVRMTIRAGNAGEGGWAKRSKDGNSESLDCEFVVLDGEHAKRKFWTMLLIAGTTPGHAEAADITARKLRAILESVHGIKPGDASDQAKAARRIVSYGDLDGASFIAKISVEPARNGFKAKNVLDRVIGTDEKEWHPVKQEPKPAAPATATAKPSSTPAIVRPAWADKR
jgi:hypothetical protein